MEPVEVGNPRRSTGLEFVTILLLGMVLLWGLSVDAARAATTTTYGYDALGRLTVVVGDDDIAEYSYDQAGNRTQTTTATFPDIPPTISVPASSTTGNYTISWGAATGSVTAYELYQATNSGFSGAVTVYNGTGTSAALSGRGNGTYYYRVRACNTEAACSEYRTGGNPIVVTLTPGVPSSISVPSSSTTGNYTISWGTSTGTVTAYQLYEATNSNFTGQVLVHNALGTSKNISGKANGSYYYRVRACNGSNCSGYRTGGNPVQVSILAVPGTPSSITIPGTVDAFYSVSWGTSSGTVAAYELYEATNSSYSGQYLVYTGLNTSQFFNKMNQPGFYWYRVRACNAAGCSGWREGGPKQVFAGQPHSAPLED
jgi:hypothetical protein